LAPFGCRVLAVDPFVPAAAVRKAGARRVTLEACLRSSDIVVLAAASNPGTRHLIGRRQVAALRKGSLLVNVARAALVDTDALIRRLRKGDMAAAIDVFNQEPLPSDHPLRRLPNAYLTPHRAGGTMGSVNRILTWLIDDTEAFVAGRPLRYPLTEAMTPALDA